MAGTDNNLNINTIETKLPFIVRFERSKIIIAEKDQIFILGIMYLLWDTLVTDTYHSHTYFLSILPDNFRYNNPLLCGICQDFHRSDCNSQHI